MPDTAYIVGALTIIAVIFGAGFAGYASLAQRMTKLETVIAMMGDAAARALHSPHTPGLDALIDRMVDPAYCMTEHEWIELRAMCAEIEENRENPKEERALAGTVVVMCDKALNRIPVKTSHSD